MNSNNPRVKALATGGARSGKSSFAEAYAASLADWGVYVATAEMRDEAMSDRIRRHQAGRAASGFDWRTSVEPFDLTGILARNADAPLVLIDCLTLWLTNHLLRVYDERRSVVDGDAFTAKAKAVATEEAEAARETEAYVERQIRELAEAIKTFPGAVIAVTNEVGGGIVPEYPLGRLYRDFAGVMNQRIAAACDEVFLVTAGIPVELKKLAFRLPPR